MRKLRFFIFGSALAAAASLGLQLPASAAVHGAAEPTSKIVANTKGVAKFKPTSLAVVWSATTEPKKGCVTRGVRAWIKNKTSATQNLTYNGSAFASIAAGAKEGVCFWGTGSASFTLALTGSTSTLTFNVT